ncbi:DUF3703 domain-containing protein [Nocardia uniformis]|uniref:DUF3703 domain-containing protein n=1 Tax=Nocardia uniformis TaxID=53432 RepID=A0A849C697_9NOCA|nr:DUF3703 domain-containing protein [Nocardia uniformis]NNH70419.1 DUF3703 domain-containing protein [Nocardia uniformis]
MQRVLERAHILFQEWVPIRNTGDSRRSGRGRTRSHWHMFVLALRTRDRGEVLGQAVRLAVAGAPSSVGRAPVGNAGRSAVSITAPMPIPEDLARILTAPR